ncbi:hypothetical protein BGZ99_007714 [Dissophora globulifera]|uniref:Mitochondrial carrier protein n=1 Tax=Dissophora globulifera TaxID=979702 RepID=A0A9P6RW58_9FUNG|nr:hypothetical protein BGZ99_007714 [Dissophora globulifera]
MAVLSSASSTSALSGRLHSTGANIGSVAAAASTTTTRELSRSQHNQQQQPSQHQALSARNTKSWDYIARTMVAGGIAGISAKTVIAPLDRVKILFQASSPQFEKYAGTLTGVFKAGRDIQRTVGLSGLFQGNGATVLRIFPYAAIKFMAYEQYRSILMPTRRDESPYKKLVAGSMADLIRVRLAYETTATSYTTLLSKIYHESAASASTASTALRLYRPALGLRSRISPALQMSNFYRGFLCSIAGMIPYAGVSFFAHDVMQEFCRNNLKWTLKLHHQTSSSSTATHRGSPDSNGDYARPELRTTAQLACGGIAGAVAMTAAYPFEVIRRKMQVAGALNPKVFVGMWDTARKLYVVKGSRGFFVGLSIGYLKVTPMVALSFTVYEKMKTVLAIN